MTQLKKFLAILFLVPALMISAPVLAADQPPDNYGLDTAAREARLPTQTAEKKPITIPQVAGLVINGFLSVIGIGFLILMLWGGFIWMKARGNEKEVERAKDMITNAIIGIIVVGSAYVFTKFVLENLVQGT